MPQLNIKATAGEGNIFARCLTCLEELTVPDKGLGRANLDAWMTQHQHVDEPINAPAVVRLPTAAECLAHVDDWFNAYGRYDTEALARDLATIAHSGQTDKVGGAYIAHPMMVAQYVREAGGDQMQIIIAWLHDTVEDTNLRLEHIFDAFALYANGDFDYDRLIAGLDAITHRKNEPRVEYYERVQDNSDALFVKEQDIAHNTSPERTKNLDNETRKRLEIKYVKAREALGI